ncbi:RNA-binding protein spenito-like [Clytia hemisphaerica]|uniref:RNA-binding protein spenito-like n=1 Tax=Clytia hemisphaerica TaxID=252671 RepID=UPI0034D69601
MKISAFNRTLHFDFDGNDYRGGDFNRGGYQNRDNFQRNNFRNNDRFNDRNDFNRGGRGNDFGKDRFNNDNHINPRATRTLFVGNLEPNITKEELMRIFDKYGAIDDIDVKRPPNGIPPYAFIKYLELDAAACAKNQMFGGDIKGRPIKVGYGKTMPSPRLWVGGLGGWCNADMLTREFDRFGALRNVTFIKGDRHAFVEFESIDAASAAYTEMRGFPLGGGPERKIKIDYAEIKRNDDRGGNYTLLTEGEEEEAMVIITGIEIQRIVLIAGGVGHVVVAQSMVTEMNQGDVIPHQEEPVHKRPPLIIIQNPYQRFQNLQIQKKKPEKPVSNSVEPYDSSKPQESLVDIAKRFVVAWKGAFALKNSAFPVRMHLIGGNPDIANFYLRGIGTGAGPAIKILNITQRLRLDQPKLDEVSRRVQQSGAGGHCMLLALPTGDEVELEVSYQRRPLKSLVTYFKKKEAAGVILMSSAEGPEGKLEETGMLHAFPPCEFSQQQLLKAAPNAGADPLNEDHLVIVVVKGTTS